MLPPWPPRQLACVIIRPLCSPYLKGDPGLKETELREVMLLKPKSVYPTLPQVKPKTSARQDQRPRGAQIHVPAGPGQGFRGVGTLCRSPAGQAFPGGPWSWPFVAKRCLHLTSLDNGPLASERVPGPMSHRVSGDFGVRDSWRSELSPLHRPRGRAPDVGLSLQCRPCQTTHTIPSCFCSSGQCRYPGPVSWEAEPTQKPKSASHVEEMRLPVTNVRKKHVFPLLLSDHH